MSDSLRGTEPSGCGTALHSASVVDADDCTQEYLGVWGLQRRRGIPQLGLSLETTALWIWVWLYVCVQICVCWLSLLCSCFSWAFSPQLLMNNDLNVGFSVKCQLSVFLDVTCLFDGRGFTLFSHPLSVCVFDGVYVLAVQLPLSAKKRFENA